MTGCHQRQNLSALVFLINSTTKVNLIPFIFDCDYDLCLLNLTNMPAFYFDILKAQTEVQRQCKAGLYQNNIRSVIWWNNW